MARRFLVRRKVIAIELEKKHVQTKAGAFVAIDEGTILYDAVYFAADSIMSESLCHP